MNQPSGRHRRPSRSLAEQVRHLATTLLAAALTYVFVPPAARRERVALGPVADRLQLPAPSPTTAQPGHGTEPESDDDPGALVRPYMPPYPPPPARPLPIPRPRLPEGDLLATPTEPAPDDFVELTAAVRAWLDMTRGADRP